MRDQDIKSERLFDRRTAERNIKKGLITRKEHTDYLNSLADAAGKAVQRSSDLPAGEAPPEVPATKTR